MKLLPKDLEVGDVFYECDHGYNYRLTVETKPSMTDDGKYQQWSWKAKNSNGDVISFLTTEGLEHYGPKIYLEPQYFSLGKTGDPDFEVFTS